MLGGKRPTTGRFLFTVNTGAWEHLPLVHRPLVQAETARQHPGRAPASARFYTRLSPDGGNLYLDESATGAAAAFAVHGGNLTELASSPTPLPAGAAPAGIVVT